MDARLQNRIQRYGWDRAVDRYEAAWSAQLRPGQDLVLAGAGLRSGERVLDTACGTGLVSLRAASLVAPGGYVLGTDISEGMVRAASAASAALDACAASRSWALSIDPTPPISRSMTNFFTSISIEFRPQPSADEEGCTNSAGIAE